MNDMMLRVTALTRANRLSEATAVIQRMLRGETDSTVDPADDAAPFGPSISGAAVESDEETNYHLLNAAMFGHSVQPWRAARLANPR